MRTIATASAGLHRPGELETLRDCGFTHITNCGISNGVETKREIDVAHELGLKYIIRWPDWQRLGMCGAEHAFRASDERHNAVGNSLVTGPSLWNPEAEEAALSSLQTVSETGTDGVLIHLLVGDRPFPTAWYLGISSAWHTKAFWCWDEWAKAERGDREMFHDATEDYTPEFYEWYQGAWFRRLQVFSDAAFRFGLNDLWTWMVPLFNPTREAVADGTAHSEKPMKTWIESARKAGASPVCVISHLFGIGFDGESPYLDSERLGREGCPLICGVEACSRGGLTTAGQNNATLTGWGVGVFAADRPFLDDPVKGRTLFNDGAGVSNRQQSVCLG